MNQIEDHTPNKKTSETRDNKLNDFGLKHLIKVINSKKKTNIEHYRNNYVKRRIKLKMGEKGFNNYNEYAVFVRRNNAELEELYNFITVNYTSFYRDKDVYDYFNDNIIPEIVNKKKTIRILSAGCSSGEEPYTLAILLKEYCEKKKLDKNISIHAIDVDQVVLMKAKKGVYYRDALKDFNKKYVKKYFKEIDEKYVISEDIKRMVKFKIHDITKETREKYYDVVFCRNVFIYFTNQAKEKTLLNFYNMMNRNSYLIMGKTEMMPMSLKDKFNYLSNVQKIFTKN